jgi:hypothetical protein
VRCSTKCRSRWGLGTERVICTTILPCIDVHAHLATPAYVAHTVLGDLRRHNKRALGLFVAMHLRCDANMPWGVRTVSSQLTTGGDAGRMSFFEDDHNARAGSSSAPTLSLTSGSTACLHTDRLIRACPIYWMECRLFHVFSSCRVAFTRGAVCGTSIHRAPPNNDLVLQKSFML